MFNQSGTHTTRANRSHTRLLLTLALALLALAGFQLASVPRVAAQSSAALTYGVVRYDSVTSRWGDTWSFSGTQGDEVVIEMTSSTMDTYLELYTPSGAFFRSDDDGGDGTNSYLSVSSLPTTGTYTVIARGYGGDTGSYTIQLVGSGSTHLVWGDRVNDQVASSAGDRWTFNAYRGNWTEITMSSSDMDPYLILLAPDGSEVARNDDHGDTTNARIYVRSLPATGMYTIIARGYNGDTGSYLLSLD